MAARKKREDPAELPRRPVPQPLPAEPAPVPEAPAAPPPAQEAVPVQRRPAFVPVPMMPDTPDGVVNNLLVRELNQPGPDPVPAESPTLRLLRLTVDALASGASLDNARNELSRVVANQDDKSRLLEALLNQLDHERLANWMESQAKVETFIHRAIRNGDLNSGEALVVYQMSTAKIAEIRSNLAKVKTGDGAAAMDRATVVETEKVERSLQRRWEGTTPQGRELIRKNLFKLKKEVLEVASEAKAVPVKKAKKKAKKAASTV